MNNTNSKIQAPCQVCGKNVLVDPHGNDFCENCGWVQNREYDKYPDDVRYPNIVAFNKAKRFCENCGWVQNREYDKYPDDVRYPNIVAFNKAKRLFAEGKPLSPSFEDFIDGLKFYKEMQFDYDGKTYGVLIRENDAVHFYLFHSLVNYQIYPSVSDFYEKAHINSTPLSSLWQEVLNAGYMTP